MLRVSALDFVCTFYGKKINITFKSIWFRFNFSSFFLVSYRCFIRQYLLVRQREKNRLKKLIEQEVKRIRENVVVIRYLVELVEKHAFSTFRCKQVQCKTGSSWLWVCCFFPFISQWKMQFCSWCSFNCNLFTLTIDMNMREKKNEHTTWQ